MLIGNPLFPSCPLYMTVLNLFSYERKAEFANRGL